MSRIGKKPISIPSGVKVEQSGNVVKATGPKGTLQVDCHQAINVAVNDGKEIVVSNPQEGDRQCRALHGTVRSLINNMIIGVSKGFERKMQIFGTGYNVKEQGGKMILQVGYCHPVELAIPKGVTLDIKTPATRGNDVPALFTVLGSDKQQLGQFAANIRRVRPPEPYKGKGIRYADELVRRKAGKAFASGAA
ncbi:MAG: 50S ribosomal protein L6 [Planctomycetes bacterium]|nr:50S ribosomal protein L6 [Planctomycetota bacterium]